MIFSGRVLSNDAASRNTVAKREYLFPEQPGNSFPRRNHVRRLQSDSREAARGLAVKRTTEFLCETFDYDSGTSYRRPRGASQSIKE